MATEFREYHGGKRSFYWWLRKNSRIPPTYGEDRAFYEFGGYRVRRYDVRGTAEMNWWDHPIQFGENVFSFHPYQLTASERDALCNSARLLGLGVKFGPSNYHAQTIGIYIWAGQEPDWDEFYSSVIPCRQSYPAGTQLALAAPIFDSEGKWTYSFEKEEKSVAK